MYRDCITKIYLNLSYIGPLSGLYSKNISKIFLYPCHIRNVSILQWYGLIFSGQHWDFIFFSYPTRSQHTRYHNDIVPIRSRVFNAAWVKTKKIRNKWYNFQLPATIVEICTILEISKKWGFRHLRQFVGSPCIHVHTIALDPL